jgi:hypothetical protein
MPVKELADLPEATVSSEKPSTPAPNVAPREHKPAPSAGFGTSFISEDDLPEWLRAIAPADGGDAESELFQFGASSDEPVAVPSISRAWTTSKDARGVDEATSVFALVASQSPQSALPAAPGGRQPAQGRPSRSDAARVEDGQGVVDSYGSSVPPGLDQRLPQIDMTMSPATPSTEVSSKFPLLPVVVAGALLLVLVLVAAAMILS